jgi:hypothetical protein
LPDASEGARIHPVGGMFNRRRRSRVETFGQAYALGVGAVMRWMLPSSIPALTVDWWSMPTSAPSRPAPSFSV